MHAPVKEKPGTLTVEPPTKAKAPEGDRDGRPRGPRALIDYEGHVVSMVGGQPLTEWTLYPSFLPQMHTCTGAYTHAHA